MQQSEITVECTIMVERQSNDELKGLKAGNITRIYGG